MIQGKTLTASQAEVAQLADLLPEYSCYDMDCAWETYKESKYYNAVYWSAQEYLLDWKVIRIFMLKRNGRQYTNIEAIQVWTNSKGQRYIASRDRVVMGTPYCDSWYVNDDTLHFRNNLRNLDENLELKYYHSKCFENAFYYATLYGGLGICFKRNETKNKSALDWNDYCEKLVKRLCRKNVSELYEYSEHYETLYKSGMHKMIKALAKRGLEVSRYWRSIKICIRNKYTPKNAELWLRYIDNLRIEKKDLCSPKWVCPNDLIKENEAIEKRIRRYAHERAEAEKHRIEQERVIRELEEANRDKEKIKVWEDKAKYLGVKWTFGEYTIRPLQSIDEYQYEGETMQHCVFRMKYWQKLGTIVLTVRDKDGLPVQTCELDLISGNILQIFGKKDHVTSLTEPLREEIKKHSYLFTNITFGETKTA